MLNNIRDWGILNGVGRKRLISAVQKRTDEERLQTSNPPPVFAQSVQLADLVASARGGGIEGRRRRRRRGGERERRWRRGSGDVTVCSVGTLGWGWLYHPWQQSARLRRREKRDGEQGEQDREERSIRVKLQNGHTGEHDTHERSRNRF